MTDSEERSNKRLKTTGEAEETAPVAFSSDDLPTIPVFTCDSAVLNGDTMEVIVDFVNGDGASYCAFTAVSKAFHSALIPRQKKVWYGGFKRYEDFLAKGFVAMELFSARNSLWFRDEVLSKIADRNRFPKLQAVDLKGCSTRRIVGDDVTEFVKCMGSRLKTFRTGLRFDAPTDDPTDEQSLYAIDSYASQRAFTRNLLLNLVAHCSASLTCLELHHITWDDSYGALFEKMVSLRELVLEWPRRLPNKLPTSLEVLRIRGCAFRRWSPLAGLDLPSLKTLEIADESTVESIPDHIALSTQILLSVMSKSKQLETFILRAVRTRSKLYRGNTAEEEERLFRFLSQNKIKYIGPKHVSRRAGASFAYDKNGKFISRSGWVGV